MLHIILNPSAGTKKAKRGVQQLLNRLNKSNIQHTVHTATNEGDANIIAKELSLKGNVDIVVVGGDGTLNAVLQGIHCFDNVRLGLIPCGTGNDFARTVGIPKKIDKALDIILNNHAEYIDYIQMADGRRAMNVAGAGMDVDTLEKYQQIKRVKGKLRYYYALFCVLRKPKYHKLKLTLDGTEMEREVFIIALANGRFIGSGMPISPQSIVNDGLLNVVIVNKLRRSQILPMLFSFLKGKHIHKPAVEQFWVKSARLEVLDEGKTEVDGEMSSNKVLDCQVISNKLQFFMSRK